VCNDIRYRQTLGDKGKKYASLPLINSIGLIVVATLLDVSEQESKTPTMFALDVDGRST